MGFERYQGFVGIVHPPLSMKYTNATDAPPMKADTNDQITSRTNARFALPSIAAMRSVKSRKPCDISRTSCETRPGVIQGALSQSPMRTETTPLKNAPARYNQKRKDAEPAINLTSLVTLAEKASL